LQRVLLSDI